MKNLSKLALVFTLIHLCFQAQAVSFRDSFSMEMKFKDGGSSGVVEIAHPVVKGSEVKNGTAAVYNFMNLQALGANRIQLLSYVCINGRVAIFTHKNQRISRNVRISTTFSSGAAARNIFPGQFSWLASLSGMNSSNPAVLACRSDFLESVSSSRIEKINNVRVGKYEIIQKKKSIFSKKKQTIITW